MVATPSNEGRWYLTFHGGDARHAWNNIHAFAADGTPLGKVLQARDLPDGVALRELRGFAFGPDGDLYVANAFKDRSQILRFGGAPDADGRHPFVAVFAERHAGNPGLAHPFDVAFGPDGHLYVPSQDTDVVGRYVGPRSREGTPGAPMALPASLQDYPAGTFHPGTFVPSARHVPDGLREVRHALFAGDGDLYVADRQANAVKRYDGTSGELRQTFASRHLAAPIHLLRHPRDGRLLVGSRDRHAVLALDPTAGEIVPLVRPGAGGLAEPSGLAVGPDGLLYVASRTGCTVLRYDVDTGEPAGGPWLRDLADQPEFLAFVPNLA